MAGGPITSKTSVYGVQPLVNKAVSAVGTVGQGISIANGIREAAPVVMGALRTAGSLLPYLGFM